MERDFDVIVIGSGAGGAAFAHGCATAGKSVLIVERGSRAENLVPPLDERATLIEKAPYDDRRIEVNDTPLRLYMGGVLGGGTAAFGAALLRPSSEDFHPGRQYDRRLDRCLWDWPIAYEELEPFYGQAEELFRLTGSIADDFSPLHPPGPHIDNQLLKLAPINERLMAASRSVGLRPFRLPLAIDTSRCARCHACAGYLCPNGARRSAAQVIDETAARYTLRVMTNAEVTRLETHAGGMIGGVAVRDRGTGAVQCLRADCYALAAGAIGSPAIALQSGIDGPHVGRNYMMHYSPIAVGVFSRPTGAGETFIKQVGFADFYFGTSDCPHKMGIVQSLPAPGPLLLKKSGLKRFPALVLKLLRNRLLPLAGIVEDLPDPRNRIFVRADGSIGLAHDFSAFDRERGAALGRAMCGILRHAGAMLCNSRPFPSREHVAHQCGTLRFGRDAAHAVVDRDCRWFGRPNLFVVDGSVLPTSMGVGPSLTIVANALRVARVAAAAI
jgi:choline dehydrogenase-like flavoprotein